jgi:hypothetical protein
LFLAEKKLKYFFSSDKSFRSVSIRDKIALQNIKLVSASDEIDIRVGKNLSFSFFKRRKRKKNVSFIFTDFNAFVAHSYALVLSNVSHRLHYRLLHMKRERGKIK